MISHLVFQKFFSPAKDLAPIFLPLFLYLLSK